MSTVPNSDLENLYKQFNLGELPIFQNLQRISIRKLFKTLTITELNDLSTPDAMNFYLYCNFFKNRLLYSEMFRNNLAYVNSQAILLKHRIKHSLDKFDQMLREVKSESDGTWIDNNIGLLNDGLIMLNSVPHRCDYYDAKVAECLDPKNAASSNISAIEAECAAEFASLATLFSEVGRIIGRE